MFACCWYCVGESLHEIKIEPDSNDITEHADNDQSTIETAGKCIL